MRPWIGREEQLVCSLHVDRVSLCFVLHVVGTVAAFMVMLSSAWCRARLACVPSWYVESTAEAHVPVVVILVWVWRSHCSCWRSLLSIAGWRLSIVGWRLLCECQRSCVATASSSATSSATLTSSSPSSSASSASWLSLLRWEGGSKEVWETWWCPSWSWGRNGRVRRGWGGCGLWGPHVW